MMMIFPIIVLYKTRLNDSTAFRSISCSEEINHFFVYDNSPKDFENDVNTDERCIYFRDYNNSGISKAYNKGVKEAKRLGYSWVLFLDQDTTIDSSLLHIYQDEIINNLDVFLFAPHLIYSDNLPFSPCRIKYHHARAVELSTGVYSLFKYAPVNSGICVSVDAFMKVGGYNEKVKLDFSDFQFIERFRRSFPFFKLVDSVLLQSFSNEETDVQKLLVRFSFYLKDAKNCDKSTFISHICYLITVLRHTFALSLRTKRTVFIKMFIINYLFTKK